jgi:hypothetical protein
MYMDLWPPRWWEPFTIVGLAGSYTRMLLKTESFNQVRQDRETLRKDYKQMAQIAHDRNVQVASLGALASEVTALYGLRQNKLATAKPAADQRRGRPAPASLALTDDVSQQQVKLSIDQFYALRTPGHVGPGHPRPGGRPVAQLCRRLDGTGRRALALAARRPRGLQLRRAAGSDQR